MQSWVCPCCGWSNLNVETKTNTSTSFVEKADNINIKYENGSNIGCAKCNENVKDIIESMAYEIAMHRDPRSYDHSEEEVESIMREFGWEG